MPGLPARAAIYLDELPRRPQPLPRFVTDFVMAQLENPANLALLPDAITRHLLVVIMETGLRANDACALAFNPIVEDSAGWPCLRYHNRKMAAEQLVPLSAKAADAIRAQQADLQARWPGGPPPRLFPSPYANPDGTRPFSYATLRQRLATWQERIGLRDEAGQAVRVTAHQFRHTLGTRMINNGVAQHVVQKMLGHATPQMTARYAIIHDATVRAAFDDYQRRRVDITGTRLDFDPEAPTADAEWVKHNLARVQASLPNGYCGRPPQQDCPHPNACLTCPDFQTTPQFLPVHRRHRDENLALLAAAEHTGRTRLAANHRQVDANLERVIHALEAVEHEQGEEQSL
jgi:site-specific recombinase XerD